MKAMKTIGVYDTPELAFESLGFIWNEDLATKGAGCLEPTHSDYFYMDAIGGVVYSANKMAKAYWAPSEGTKLGRKDQNLIFQRAIKAQSEDKACERNKNKCAAECAERIWELAQPCKEHPFLTKRHLKPVDALRIIDYKLAYELHSENMKVLGVDGHFGFKCSGGQYLSDESPLLVFPFRNLRGEIQSVMLVDNVGQESFLYGSRYYGAFWGTDPLEQFEAIKKLGVTQSVASALCVRQLKQFPVIAAASLSNLKVVVKELYEGFDQFFLLLDANSSDPEIEVLARQIHAYIAKPEFDATMEQNYLQLGFKGKPNNFSDFYLLKGEI